MLNLILSMIVLAATWATLRGGFRGSAGFQIAGFDLNAAGLAVVAVAAAMYFFGVLYGVALIVAVIIHEFGHVAAFRVCGHADARFRLVPLMGGVAISNRLPASQLDALFITLMGPAICLGPMALCFALPEVFYKGESDLGYQIANYLYIQGIVLGALNFFNLLPLWPLDGGKIAHRLIYAFFPGAVRHVSIAMMMLAAALCLFTRSYILLIFVLISWQSLQQFEQLLQAQRPIAKPHAFLALAAYGMTTAAFFVGGAAMLSGWS